ncbi:uncharacterized protein PITG_03562 [Phytophthora infestans T30-4]|uniref:FHA domain-containing protein n=1 Tax=Phytophthora infestans (strain T30-4) TaxID=403677 RepID=D0MXX6_PHYIT|nr:uncharacterized protein PITG_03562 [Phytophthora infestans T30-4]EEY66024.1 conserved hypothetical protein [Phytophthora infestans T30-4]|eukprot:XP_002906623.1 conserved hypothetical protein [Phytophthora infestans T30-4]
MAMKRKTSEVSAKTTALIIDGAYARIHGRSLGGNIDFSRLRTELEEIASTEFDECWYFDSQRRDAPGNSQLASEFHALKYARPRGPQLQVEIYSTKPRSCKCTSCGHKFNQNVQKGVDNGIATKLLTLTLTRNIERVILVSGDGDFYTSLRYVRNELAREVWVVGFLDTVSGDLQQLASQIMWIDEMWGDATKREATTVSALISILLMWVLDVVAGDGADTTFYLVAGEWSVGRKRCHFNFHADSSISRTHALIRVGALTPEQLRDPSTRPTLELVDKNSRFGSFVNQEQIFGTRILRHGDQISFGAKKTVLRVRYQVFVLVASRIQRANRVQVNDTCQRLGMHLVAAESKDATHCIMDPGRIVATVKVLWALVYNQPVVCTPWIYAILNRSSLPEPLPRCEEFLPSDPLVPSVESNYLPNSLRKSLFQGYAVVFLTPQSMQELIPAMGGVVAAAYKGFEEDDNLLLEHEDDDVKSSREDDDEDVDAADVTIKENSEQQTDPLYEEAKRDMFEDSNINIVQIPSLDEAQMRRTVISSFPCNGDVTYSVAVWGHIVFLRDRIFDS